MRARAKHFWDTTIHPGWRLFTFITLDVLGAILTWREEFQLGPVAVPGLPAMSIQWGWELWLAATGFGLALLIFEGSYRIRTRIEMERDQLRENLETAASPRALTIEGGQWFYVTERPTYLHAVHVHMKNTGDRTLRFNIDQLFIEINGLAVAHRGVVVGTGGFIPPHSPTHYVYGFAETDTLGGHAANVKLIVKASYDSVPPLLERHVEKHILYKFGPGEHVEAVVLLQDES